MRKNFILAFAIALLSCVFVQAQSNQQLTFFSGSTSVHLSSEFNNALRSLGVRADGVFPGRLLRGTASFPITDGTINADDLKGEIIHSGGLRLRAGATTVKLRSFIIDVSDSGIVLTGHVSANGNTVGRIPLFDLTLPPSTSSLFSLQRVRLNNVAVTLRPEAAAALNSVFNVNAFTPGFPIGSASVNGFAYNN